MKRIIASIFALFLLAPVSSLQSSELEVTPAHSSEIVGRLREKYIPMYRKYQGVESDREVRIQTYDAKTNELLRTEQVHLIRKDYFYDEPEVRVLEYTVDGKKEDPSNYSPLRSQPGYPVFDETGEKNYEIQVVGYKTIEGTSCYEVDVTPKKATKLHYRGKLYYTVADLRPVLSSGSIGKISFPLKALQVDLYIDDLDDLTVVSSGAITARLHIPIILPDRRIESNFKSLGNKPIF